jgi:hypothetical protein
MGRGAARGSREEAETDALMTERFDFQFKTIDKKAYDRADDIRHQGEGVHRRY